MQNKILIRGARANNLKDITVEIPKNKLVVITGLSGSGKSSLAFDTIFAEGQRRYVESLSSYARQFLELQDKPDVDEIRGLAPTIAIDQRGLSENPRSTVGTVTEIADYLRLLFARVGRPKCLTCNVGLSRASAEEIVRTLQGHIAKEPVRIYAPIVRPSNVPPLRLRGGEGEFRDAHNPPQPSLNSDALRGRSPTEASDLRGGDIADDLTKRLARAGFEEVRLNGERMPLPILKEVGLPAASFTLEAVIGAYGPQELREDPEHVRMQILTALELGDGTVMAEVVNGKPPLNLPLAKGEKEGILFFSKDLTCPKCGTTYPPIEPRNFSFNSPHGACPECGGLGVTSTVVPELVMPNPRLSIKEGAIKPWTRVGASQSARVELLEAVAAAHNFSTASPIGELSKRAREIILHGTGETVYTVKETPLKFQGVIPELQARYRETDSDYLRREIESYMRQERCPSCQGARLRPEALSVTFAEKNIAQLSSMSVEEAMGFFSSFWSLRGAQRRSNLGDRHGLRPRDDVANSTLTDSEITIAAPIIREILARLEHLKRAGLGYLTLQRAAPALSGGEGQRVRLAVQLSSPLSGVIYILDEPTVGLHERDTELLLRLLKQILEQGNTVLVVEHDPRIMKEADWIIDMGPGAGAQGGRIIAQGTLGALMKRSASLTGAYLARKKEIHLPEKLRKGNGKALTIKDARAFNLKNIDARIPLGLFVCVTGVSGSGKSTLILEILAKSLAHTLHGAQELPAAHKEVLGVGNIDKVITVDQTPIGRTPRSNPATYTGIFTLIRDLYTAVPEAKLKGFDAGTFSFNVKGGRCETCAGEGYLKIPMQFMSETYLVCNECHGSRYRPEALEIHYQQKNIADILKMSALEARGFFADVPLLHEKLQILEDVGLGYIRLGQPAPTLSGGEAQRVKLATELSRRATGKTLYILDEPTTGLHFEDVAHLLTVLQRLVDKGNTVLVIEHNLEVIKCADFVIDLGPEGGEKGGEIVAQGTPREICKIKRSYTGQYLKKVLRG